MIFVLNDSTPKKAIRPFIEKPFFQDFQYNNLNYLDVLTHVSIKSFDNAEGRCFPSYETIADKAGLCRKFVIQSVKRLEESKYLSVYRNPKFKERNRCYPNFYSFPNFERFTPIPYEFLKINDLTPYQKAMLLLLRQFANTARDISGSITTFAKQLGLSYQTVDKQYKHLVERGYLDDSNLNMKRTKLLRIDWSFPEQLPIKPHKPTYNPSDIILMIT